MSGSHALPLLIDFARSTHAGFNDQILNEGPDLNFIQGLKNLIQVLDEIKVKAAPA